MSPNDEGRGNSPKSVKWSAVSDAHTSFISFVVKKKEAKLRSGRRRNQIA